MAHAAPLPEPKTPLWFTALGIGLFLLAGLGFVLRSSEDTAQAAPAAQAEAQPQAAALPPPQARAQAQAQGKAPPKIDTAGLKQLADRLRQQQEAAGTAPAGADPHAGHGH